MMDADEQLARQLQAEENAALTAYQLKHRLLHGSGGMKEEISNQIKIGVQKVMQYERQEAQHMAREAMPLQRLQEAAADAARVSRLVGEQPPLAEADALAQELLSWFKLGFFTWVDQPACSICGSASTVSVGVEEPTYEESSHDAGRTEVYRCTSCFASVRFPRYNDAAKLLKTRRGRCGEWANCFCLCLRAAGLPARWIYDFSDHVWCEYWSEAQQRWIHLDPCEAAYDQPLLYERGWGKEPSWVLAVSCGGAADVTRRYTADMPLVLLRRASVPEPWLQAELAAFNKALRRGMPLPQLVQLRKQDAAEAVELAACGLRGAQIGAPLPGRQTGSAAWRSSRGETGSSPVTKAMSDASKPCSGGTRWRRAAAAAQDPPGSSGSGSSPAERALSGLAVRASGENAPSEFAAKAFDRRQHTKWLDFGGAQNPAWLECFLLPPAAPAAVTSYALTSADDAPERDPCDFVLEGAPENPARGHSAEDPAADEPQWRVLDAQEEVRFSSRGQRLSFKVEGAPACRRFRLTVSRVRDATSASAVQLACLDLFSVPGASDSHTESQRHTAVPSDSVATATIPAAAAIGDAHSKAEFAARVKQQFERLMISGSMAPAAAAAEALKVATGA